MKNIDYKISRVWKKLDIVSDQYLSLLFELQSLWLEDFCNRNMKDLDPEFTLSMTKDCDHRFLEIKDMLQTEFFERFRQELYPMGMENESLIPTKIETLKMGVMSPES